MAWTTIPDTDIDPDSPITTGLITALRDNIIDTAYTSGTRILFQQTSAPTFWTKVTTHNNKALRVVSGTAGSGGSVAFTTAFASQAVLGSNSATALSIAQMPAHDHGSAGAHTHAVDVDIGTDNGGATASAAWDGIAGTLNTSSNGAHTHASNGSGSTHNHTFTGTAINMAVQYVDLIIASKD